MRSIVPGALAGGGARLLVGLQIGQAQFGQLVDGPLASCQSQNARKSFRIFLALLRWSRGFQLVSGAAQKPGWPGAVPRAGEAPKPSQSGRAGGAGNGAVSRAGAGAAVSELRGRGGRPAASCSTGAPWLSGRPAATAGVGAGRVDLGGGDLGMAQQLAQAGDGHAGFGQLAGIGVAQLMRGELHAGLCAIAMQQPLDAVGAQRLAAFVEEHIGLIAGGAHRQPGRQHGIGIGAEQDQPLFAAFAQDPQAGRLVGLAGASRSSSLGRRLRPPAARRATSAQTRPGRAGSLIDRPQLARCSSSLKVARQALRLFARMALEAHRVGPAQVAALFGQEVEEDLQGGHPALDGRRPETRLRVGWSTKASISCIVTSRQGLAQTAAKLAHIADVVDRGAATGRPPLQVLGELFKIAELVHDVSLSAPEFTAMQYNS